jgi:transcriptional regulator with XRE-family HTH domain
MPRRIISTDPTFAARLRKLRTECGMSFRDFGTISRSYVQELESGRKRPTPEIAEALDRALSAGGTLAALVSVHVGPTPISAPGPTVDDDEIDALDLARRVAASDVGEETVTRLELMVDDLATRYSVTPPAELLHRTRRYLTYTASLLDASTRKTLAEHRRLIVVSAWLSLLAATLHIDLNQRDAGDARLATAASLAQHAGHPEIHAWTLETKAWALLTDGDYRGALALSQTAQQLAPRGSSVEIQATAQEGRAWARLGQIHETHDALDRVARLVSPLQRPDRPEHHYRYDPDKAVAYIATTLAWVGDAAAEPYAREVIATLRGAEHAGGWPRRVAAAQIDLGLALIAAGKPDEAAASAQTAILSGRIVPSNHWRALEVVNAVERIGLPEAPHLRDAYEVLRAGRIPMPALPAVADLAVSAEL